MNLANLMDSGADPGVIRSALRGHFDAVETLPIAGGAFPFEFAILCFDRHEAAPRLLVLFCWTSSGWLFSAAAPKHILPRLRFADILPRLRFADDGQ